MILFILLCFFYVLLCLLLLLLLLLPSSSFSVCVSEKQLPCQRQRTVKQQQTTLKNNTLKYNKTRTIKQKQKQHYRKIGILKSGNLSFIRFCCIKRTQKGGFWKRTQYSKQLFPIFSVSFFFFSQLLVFLFSFFSSIWVQTQTHWSSETPIFKVFLLLTIMRFQTRLFTISGFKIRWQHLLQNHLSQEKQMKLAEIWHLQ